MSQSKDDGRSGAEAPSGLRPDGLSQSSLSQAKPLVPNALSDQEHYYLHSILRSLRGLEQRVCEDWQGVSLQSEALSDNIEWLDCYIEARCPTRGACDQCWPKEQAA